MRNLVLYTLLSLDGVADDPSSYLADFDAEMVANLARVIGTQDIVLLGRRTYDEWAEYWPTSDIQPFADFINSTRKLVFTSSAPTTGWAHATVATGTPADVVTELKSQPGGDIGVPGSIDLPRSMLRAGLVDQLALVVAPALAGRGRPLFDADLVEDGEVRRLELLQATGTPSGGVLLDYRLR